MPLVQISMLKGRDQALIKKCLKEIAMTVHKTLGAPLDSVRVIATEVDPGYWVVGDLAKDETRETSGAKNEG